MRARLTIVMYHYVRDLPRTRYPRLKALGTQDFRGQLGYLRRHYEFVTMPECLAALAGRLELPPNPVLLTFDDGYLEHFTTVFPLLEELKIRGSFFVPGRAVEEGVVLDVNKIHFVLASVDDPDELLQQVRAFVEENREALGLDPYEVYVGKIDTSSRFDSEAVIVLKRLLQSVLPPAARSRLVDDLFRRYVTPDERAFAHELYMSPDQLRCLQRHGMFVGSHGYEHDWLGTYAPVEQERDVAASLRFLAKVGAATEDWVMCYPYGSFNATLLELLRRRGCRLGLTTRVGIAELSPESALTLDRLDTNDLPKHEDAPPSAWTCAVTGRVPGEEGE